MNSKLIKKCGLIGQAKVESSDDIFLTKSSQVSPRHDWERQFKLAIANGELPENELLESFSNNFDKNEWTW